MDDKNRNSEYELNENKPCYDCNKFPSITVYCKAPAFLSVDICTAKMLIDKCHECLLDSYRYTHVYDMDNDLKIVFGTDDFFEVADDSLISHTFKYINHNYDRKESLSILREGSINSYHLEIELSDQSNDNMKWSVLSKIDVYDNKK
jgi:hypothetical protein